MEFGFFLIPLVIDVGGAPTPWSASFLGHGSGHPGWGVGSVLP